MAVCVKRAGPEVELMLSELELFVTAWPERPTWAGPGLMSLLKPRKALTSLLPQGSHQSVQESNAEACCLTHHRA